MGSGETAKPELLYISPVIPGLTGNGLAMRAGMVLEALAAKFSISLLVVELYAAFERDLPTELARLCRRVTVVQPGSGTGWLSRWVGPWAAYYRTRFDVIHVFRLADARAGSADGAAAAAPARAPRGVAPGSGRYRIDHA